MCSSKDLEESKSSDKEKSRQAADEKCFESSSTGREVATQQHHPGGRQLYQQLVQDKSEFMFASSKISSNTLQDPGYIRTHSMSTQSLPRPSSNFDMICSLASQLLTRNLSSCYAHQPLYDRSLCLSRCPQPLHIISSSVAISSSVPVQEPDELPSSSSPHLGFRGLVSTNTSGIR